MLTIDKIQALTSRQERAENSVLTVYLDVDQSQQTNLNRGFEKQLKDMVISVRDTIRSEEEMKAFKTASQRMQDFAARYHVRARGLATVFDASDGFFWSEEVDFPLRNRIRWGREVFVQPLAVAIDEYERVGIVLLDRANLRLFTMFCQDVSHPESLAQWILPAAHPLKRSATPQCRSPISMSAIPKKRL